MQYKCDKCNDSGSLNKFGPYYDCTSCDAAEQRVALEKWCSETQQRGPSFDDCWAIHQRALAMAPKQETAPCSECDGRGFTYWGEGNPGNGFDVAPEPPEQECCQSCGGSDNASKQELPELPMQHAAAWESLRADVLHGVDGLDNDQVNTVLDMIDYYMPTDNTAPAAANGTMPELPEIQMDHLNVLAQHYTADQMRAYGQACAAAGPDAALVKALENIVNIEDKMVGGDWEEIDEARTIARAALSGAKWN